MKKSLNKKRILIIALAIVLAGGAATAITIINHNNDNLLDVASPGDIFYDHDWTDIDCTFSDYSFAGYNGNKFIYKSKSLKTTEEEKAVWSKSELEHKFGNYSVAVSGNNIEFFYTRESEGKWDGKTVMQIDFSLYRISHPSEKYKFRVRRYISSEDNGNEARTGYLTDVRNPVGSDLVPDKYLESTLRGLEYLYPNFYLDFNSLAEALYNGSWRITLDRIQIYDDYN